MSGDQVTITQIGETNDYVRLWDNSASAFVDLDDESKSVAGTSKDLIEQTADYLYIGNDSTFAYIGFLPDTAGSYGTVTVEYWNGAWIDMTSDVKVDSTSGFSARGFFAFPIKGDWVTTAVDSQTAYWIRLSVASVTTMATMKHMMRSLVINQVLQFGSNLGDPAKRYTRDINSGLNKRDMVYKGPRSGHIDMTPVSLETGTQLNLLLDWERYRQELYIEDSRITSPISFPNDSYYSTYTGRLVKVPDGFKAMEKMVNTDYKLQFYFDSYTSLSTTLGLTA